MSLINQMLKDLDKRGSGASGSNTYPTPIRSVPEKSSGTRLVVLAVLLLAVTSAAAAWYFWQRPKAPAVPPQAKAAPAPVPAQKPAELPAVQAVAPQPLQAASAEKPIDARKSEATPETAKDKLSIRPKASAPAASTEAAMKLAMGKTMSSIPAPAARPAKPAPARQTAPAPELVIQGKEMTPQQKAENDFNQAIALINAGRKAEAIVMLEGALSVNPRHAAARQTLTGLLLDARRSADAARVLEEGLGLDPKQTGMAMILARIQVEKNDAATALATLERSRPHASASPDYLAFMAALMQREKRHKDAIALYSQALNRMPQQAHWWMGYGISLLADKRPTDARQAFIRARDSDRLSPELQAYVEQEISKL